jgi:hypothetical protein
LREFFSLCFNQGGFCDNLVPHRKTVESVVLILELQVALGSAREVTFEPPRQHPQSLGGEFVGVTAPHQRAVTTACRPRALAGPSDRPARDAVVGVDLDLWVQTPPRPPLDLNPSIIKMKLVISVR